MLLTGLGKGGIPNKINLIHLVWTYRKQSLSVTK